MYCILHFFVCSSIGCFDFFVCTCGYALRCMCMFVISWVQVWIFLCTYVFVCVIKCARIVFLCRGMYRCWLCLCLLSCLVLNFVFVTWILRQVFYLFRLSISFRWGKGVGCRWEMWLQCNYVLYSVCFICISIYVAE